MTYEEYLRNGEGGQTDVDEKRHELNGDRYEGEYTDEDAIEALLDEAELDENGRRFYTDQLSQEVLGEWMCQFIKADSTDAELEELQKEWEEEANNQFGSSWGNILNELKEYRDELIAEENE